MLSAIRSPSVSRVASNFAWLVGEKGITLLLTLTVSVWVARYLGPELFGVMSYAVAFVGLFQTFTYLGISGIAVRDLVEHPSHRDELLGTVFVLKLLGALVAIGGIWIIAKYQTPSSQVRLLIAILSLGLVFQSLSVISFWYQSRIEGKYTVLPSIVSAVAAAVANVVLIQLNAPLAAFAVVLTLQHGLSTLGLFILYHSHGYSAAQWRFRASRAKALIAQSWPLILSAIGSVIYLKIDQVMLGHLSGPTEVGIYAVAAQLSEVWYFIPTALAASLFPKIIQFKRLSERRYHERMQWIYRLMAILGLAIAIAVTIMATPVITRLYGSEFSRAAPVLMVHIWACPMIFMGAVLSKWLVSEGLLVFSFTRHGMGALTNVGLNLILIPRYGAVGAAVATVISYTVAAYLSCFSDHRTFATGLMMTRALFTPLRGLLAGLAPRRS